MRKVLEAIWFTPNFLIPFFLKINKSRFIFRLILLNDFFHVCICVPDNWCCIVMSGRRSFFKAVL